MLLCRRVYVKPRWYSLCMRSAIRNKRSDRSSRHSQVTTAIKNDEDRRMVSTESPLSGGLRRRWS